MVTDRLCYRTFALALKKVLISRKQITAAKLLLEWIANYPGVVNSDGEPYTITDSYASLWANGKEEIPDGIQTAVAKNAAVNRDAEAHFSDVLDQVSPHKEDDLYAALWKLINASEIAPEKVGYWRSLYDQANYACFLANVFLYAVGQKNRVSEDAAQPVETPSSISASDIELLNQLAVKMKKPEAIIPPADIADDELPYIEELLGAYADATSTRYEKKSELPQRYQSDFERRRKDYYAAETINRNARDALGDGGPGEFIVLKNDMFNGVIDTCEKAYTDGFQRLLAVMEQATRIAPGKSLFERTTWIGPSERKGVCHILAGEKQLRWVYTNV